MLPFYAVPPTIIQSLLEGLRIAFVVFALAFGFLVTASVAWAAWLGIQHNKMQDKEIPGFALWLANTIRKSRRWSTLYIASSLSGSFRQASHLF